MRGTLCCARSDLVFPPECRRAWRRGTPSPPFAPADGTVGKAWAVAGKRAGFCCFGPLEHRRQPQCGDSLHDDRVIASAWKGEQGRCQKVQRFCPSCFRGVARGDDLLGPVDAKNCKLDAAFRPFALAARRVCLAASSGQAPTPHSGAPKARGLAARARTERSSNVAAMGVVFGHCPRDQVPAAYSPCALANSSRAS